MIEKRNIIESGRTPPEDTDDKSKQAATKDLEDCLAKRASDRAEKLLEYAKRRNKC